MYMRPPPSSLAPAPGMPPSNSGTGMPAISSHAARFYELLDALKVEYDMSVQQSSSMHHDSSHKMTQADYEIKGKLLAFLRGLGFIFCSSITNK